ncbi:Putative ATP-dependent 6-phosphofructokinase isozyme 2 [Paraburkholderia caffeinitolerans]|uniref:Phosphofructokinase n=1 Tax=Paraburkholderia caffeinitolerans TaxID=1723730 RepID=A0A6J5FXB1_9BURK|nr:MULTISPECIES: 1-phosphofructokinase family hexose kinase [Paraburkholderia]CAB3789089.1 Putative ATP-dependent 6-phosphofructokinase isozyme 2 [Paraburkholderia caffeinitolerans]
MIEILTLTANPAVDVSTAVERVIDTHKLRCDTASRYPGGGGINVARVIQRLDGAQAHCRALYLAGGVTGELLEQLLAAERVDSRRLHIAGETRENFSVKERSTGREFRFVLPGAPVEAAEWVSAMEACDALVPAPRYLVMSGSLPPGVPARAYADLAQRAHARGTRVALDTSGAPLALALEAGVYLVKPSLGELAGLAGRPLADEAAQLAAAREIVARRRAEIVALTLGDRGALLVSAQETIRVKALPVSVSSAIGAGDSFLAGLVVALRRGDGLAAAARLAQAAASATLLTSGTALCDAAQVQRFYDAGRPVY